MSMTVSQLKTQFVAAAQEAKQLIRQFPAWQFPAWHQSILATHARNTAVSRIPVCLTSHEMKYAVGQSLQQRAHLNTTLRFERVRNGIQPRPNNPLATYSELDPRYRPSSSCHSFSTPLVPLAESKAAIYRGHNPSKEVVSKYLGSAGPYLAIHPQIYQDPSVTYMREIIESQTSLAVQRSVQVIPTASSRTVFVSGQDAPPHCLKLHFPKQITRSKRDLTGKTIEHSIAISDRIATSMVAKRNPWFAYLPETFGVAYGTEEDSWGYLVREMTPRPFVGKDRLLIPLFSLYSPDAEDPNAKPLLAELILHSGMDPKTYITNKILFPLLQCWVDTFLETGVVLEAHGQNTCIELNDTATPVRMVFRDFDTYVNKEIREKNGLSLKGLMLFKNEDLPGKPQGSTMSMVYDQAMRVPFDRIAQVAEKEFGIPKETLQKECRGYLRQIFTDIDRYFPKDGKVYNYEDKLVLAPGVKTKLTATDEPLVWR